MFRQRKCSYRTHQIRRPVACIFASRERLQLRLPSLSPIRCNPAIPITTGSAYPPSTVSVVAADTTPTIRFLYQEMWVVEGSTNRRNIRSVDELDVRTVTIKLDIAPAPSRNGNVIWHVPQPECHTVGHRSNLNLSGPVGCVDGWQPSDPAADYARYNVDYIPDGLMGRHVAFTSGSNDMEFTFDIRSDNVLEDRRVGAAFT